MSDNEMNDDLIVEAELGEEAFENDLFDVETQKEIVLYLDDEITQALDERSRFINDKVKKWRKQRKSIPLEEVKNFPWKGASNISVPLTEINSNGLAASMKEMFSQKQPFWSVDPLNEKYNPHAKALQKYINLLGDSKFHINIREKNNEIFYDTVSLGTEFIMVPWNEDIHTFKRKNENGELEEKSVTRKKGPDVVPIRLEDFITRSYVTDIQRAPWVAIRHELMWHELKQRENQGIYFDIDNIKESNLDQTDENKEDESLDTGLDIKNTDLYEIYECFCFWDIDDSGVPTDIKIWFEPSTRTVIRVELNDLGTRPLIRIPYIPIPNSLYAKGVCWMCEGMQDGTDALMNMAINSTHISSLQMFATKRGSSIGATEDFYPFKQLVFDNPKEDMNVIQFPNTAGPNLQLIGILRELADRVTGATNSMMGFPDSYAKTRATASGTMFLAQQGSKLFNAVAENIEDAYERMAMLIVFQLMRHKDRVDLNMLGEEDKILVKEILDMEIEDIHLNFGFKISSTEIDQTEEAKRQMILTLSQLYSMYGQQTLQLIQGQMGVMMQANPQAAQQLSQKYMEFSNQFLVGSQKLMTKVLEFSDTEKEGYLPYVKDIAMMLEIMNSMKDQQVGRMENAVRQISGQNGNVNGAGQAPGQPMGGPGQQTGNTQGVQPPEGTGPNESGNY